MRSELQSVADAIQQQLDSDCQIAWDEEKRATLIREITEAHPGTAADLKELLETAEYPDTVPFDQAIRVDTVRICVRMIQQVHSDTMTLLEIAKGQQFPWYVRQEALFCLCNPPCANLPTNFEWSSIIDIVVSNETGELRSAALDVITSHRHVEALPRIQSIELSGSPDGRLENWFDGQSKLQMARAALGDSGMYINTIQKTFNPWSHTKQDAYRSMQALAETHGGLVNVAKAIAADAGITTKESEEDIWVSLSSYPNFAVQRWAIENLETRSDRSVSHCVDQLGSSDWGVRKSASDALVRTKSISIDHQLRDVFGNEAVSQVLRSWAANTLIRRGNDAFDLFDVSSQETRELWRVPWPFPIDERIRTAIVSHYAIDSEEGTDIRYLIEAELLDQPDYDDPKAASDRNRLVGALREAGIPVTAAKECGDYHQQGGGTFWVVNLGDESDSNQLFVSTLGPFASYINVQRHQSETSSSTSWEPASSTEDLPAAKQVKEMQLCQQIATNCGYIWIEGDGLFQSVPGLNVYFFGNREPLRLYDLVYYWQD